METGKILKPWKVFYRLRWVSALAVLAVAAVCAKPAANLPLDPSNLAMFERDQPFRDNLRFQNAFGGDDTVVIGAGNVEVLSLELIGWLSEMAQEFKERPEVESIQNLAAVKGIERKGWKVSDFTLTDDFLKGEETSDELRERFKEFHEWITPLMNEATSFTASIITLKPDLTSDERHEVIKHIRSWLKAHPVKNASFYLSGTAVEQDSFIARIQRDHRLFVPLTFAVMMLVLLIFFGHWLYMIYPAAVIIATILSTQALMTWLNVSMNVVTSLVAPVILIISISDVIHIQSHVRHVGRRPRPERALAVTFYSLAMPCLLTTLTTMAGFLSLMISHVPAIRQFGFFSGFGTGIALLWTFLLAPVFFMSHINKTNTQHRAVWAGAAEKLTTWSLRRSFWIMAAAFLILDFGFYGLTQLRINTDILDAFKAGDPFRQDTEKIQKELDGIYPLEFFIHTEKENPFSDPGTVLAWSRFKKSVEELDGVSYARYVTDIINVLDRAVRGKDAGDEKEISDFYLKKYTAGMSADTNPELKRVLSDDFRNTRLTVFLKSSDTKQVTELVPKIKRLIPQELRSSWQIVPAGQTYLLARMSQNLVKSELWSIAIAMAAIWLMFVFWFRSFSAATVSVLVNALALTVMIGSMPFLKMTLNTATATIGSVAVGLIVDHSIHVLYRFKQNMNKVYIKKNIAHVMSYCAQPMICTTIILISGFAVTLFGSIHPTVQFGMMMIGVLATALAANLLILPIGLMIVGKKRNESV